MTRALARYAVILLAWGLILALRVGPVHAQDLDGLNQQVVRLHGQGKYAEAIEVAKRALALAEKALGPEHPSVATTLNNLAELYWAQGRYGEAEPLYKRSLAIREKALGPEHPDVGASLNNLAWLALAQLDFAGAADRWWQATALLERRLARGLGGAPGGSLKGETQQNSWYFLGLVKTTYRLAPVERKGSERAASMLEIAQWALASEAAGSLAQMAARGASGSSELAALVRERQDFFAEWQLKDKQLIAAKSELPARRNAATEKALSDRLAAIDARLAEIDRRLARDFPDYAALANPRPISVADVQAKLTPDEVLILFLDTGNGFKPLPEETFIWVVTKTDMRWLRADIGTKALTEKVAKLRRGLDPTGGGARGTLQHPTADNGAFDLALAHELYAALLGPAEDLIRDKKHLIVVPSGPLTALPFHVLVTARPDGTAKATDRGIPWLARRHAITTLPSVASLAALRRTSAAKPAPHPLVAFADPVFRRGTTVAADALKPRGFADYFRGVDPDAAALSGLRPLPDTADEVRAIAKTLGPGVALHIGREARESVLKRLPLDQYRVVQFATHGLIAGEIKGLAEPALALTVPDTPTPDDDGLLTASEVTALKLNAEWVILSACNTAAGDRPGAEALSGLARAFFYAGTRALLVSHWPVKSSAAVKLTTGTFDALSREPGIGRSEALRRAMLAMIDAGGTDAHPASWAPFVVVGEGGAER